MIWNENKECMSRDERRELQSSRLRKLVDYVYHNTPFYRNKMQAMNLLPSDIKDIDDIVKLPFTTKQDLRDTYPYGMFAAPIRDIVRLHASTGTTGKPTVVGYTRQDLAVWQEAIARVITAAGGARQDIISVGYGYGLFTGGLGFHYGVEHMGATVIPTSTGNSEKHVRLLRDFGITGLAVTPSYALYLSEVMDKMGIDPASLQLRFANLGGEPWSPQMRKDIEQKLHLKAYNCYGLSEIVGPGVAYECEEQNGSHFNEDHFYPEILCPDTLQPVPAGDTGELVITTLTKTGMPLLRYRTKDITSLDYAPCPCGRTNVRLNAILGRSDDMLIIRGINVYPSQVESVILDMPEFEPHYLLIVDRVGILDSLEVQVEVRSEYYSDELSTILALKKKLSDRLKSVLSIKAAVKLVEPNSIERTAGKSKRVIDKRELK